MLSIHSRSDGSQQICGMWLNGSPLIKYLNPLKLTVWTKKLQDHPDQDFAKYIFEWRITHDGMEHVPLPR